MDFDPYADCSDGEREVFRSLDRDMAELERLAEYDGYRTMYPLADLGFGLLMAVKELGAMLDASKRRRHP